MSAPLYHPLSAQSPPLGTGNAGLWFDKFCDRWGTDWRLDAPKKLAWIQTVARAVGDKAQLAAQAERLDALIRAAGGLTLQFKSVSRFATGLGREHPVENGFAWHHSLGTPYLPGSSVKGLVRAWARLVDSPESVDRICGPRDLRGASARSGTVIFFDALPLRPVPLSADVMTPHFAPYYEKGDVPGDWHSPIPIPFLTVAPGASFLFALAPRTAAALDDCQQAAAWLEQALLELGAGAKTAVGYGRFDRDREGEKCAAAEREAQRIHAEEENRRVAERAALEARLASLSPLAQELERAAQISRWDENKDTFTASEVIESWLTRLEADPQPDAVARLRGLLDRHFPNLLANPGKTEGKKNKPAFKDRWRAAAKRLNALSRTA